MSYFRYIDNGVGPVKLFVGGVHGREGRTSIRLLKKLGFSDFSCGQIFIYNFDDSEYISTLKSEFYESEQGKEILSLINYYKPDFYTELHSYQLNHYPNLTDSNRFKSQGVPPCTDFGDYFLIGSPSLNVLNEFNRLNKFDLNSIVENKVNTSNTIAQILEVPCFESNDFDEKEEIANFEFDMEKTCEKALNYLKLISLSENYSDFEKRVCTSFPNEVKLAIKYFKLFYKDKVFSKKFD